MLLLMMLMVIPMEHNQQGSTLIIVVWFIAIIGVIVTFLFYRTEVEWASVVNVENQRRYVQTAEGILHQYLGLLVKDDTAYDSPKDPWYGNGRVELEQDGFQITVIIEDEGSKPNLNIISEAGLQRIIQNWEQNQGTPQNKSDLSDNTVTPAAATITGNASQPDTQISLDPLLDWRDRDSELRADGAELSYYQALNPPYKPRDGCFSSLEELKQVKDGVKLYSILAPEVTIYGKINPNIITGETFVNLLNSYGEFQKGWLDTVKDQFESYFTEKKHFDKMDDFLQLPAISIGTLDKIKPLFQFSGSCNVNMASKTNLTVILKEASYSDSIVIAILKRRGAKSLERIADIYGLLGYKKAKGQVCPDDYLTTSSTLIHYQIWVSKGSGQYYLDTVWQRQMEGLKKEWQITPISFRELRNKAVPEIPKVEENKNDDDQSKKGI
jgi:type II secretory pathway component PulK